MIKPQPLKSHIMRYIAGDDSAGDLICANLEPVIRTTVQRALSSHDIDCDDVIQDSLLAMLKYLRRVGKGPDNPEAFVVTIARNRCLNLHVWRKHRIAEDVDRISDKLPQVAASPLDMITEKERLQLLEDAMDSLDDRCRELLESIYRSETAVEHLRRTLGLESVQAVYHRRNICLTKARKFLNRRLFVCHPDRNGRHSFRLLARTSKESKDE